jgi:adenylate cyclase
MTAGVGSLSSKVIKAILLSPWLALLTFALLASIKLSEPRFIESVKLNFYDQLMLEDTPTVSEDIVILNISEKTLEKYGQYPFSRDIYAKIYADAYNNGAALVGTTILMPEADRFGGDPVLADLMRQAPLVLSQTVSVDCTRNNTSTKRTGVAVIGDGKATDFLPNYPCVLDNVSTLQDRSAGVGVTSTLPEVDGVVRRVPLLAFSKGEYYPAFALELLRVAAGDPSYQAKVNETGVEAVRVPQYDTVETDEYGRVFVNWNKTFQQFDIGDSTLPDLQGKIVIVGVTAAGIQNPVPTPVGAQSPQYIQAALLQTMLDGSSVNIPFWMNAAEWAGFVVLGLAVIGLARVRYSFVWTSLVILIVAATPYYILTHYNILVDVTYIIATLVIIYLHVTLINYLFEYLQKMQIKKQFGTYLSPDLVAQLQKQPDLLQLGGTEQELTIMFTDVRGFTAISEHYGKDVQGLTSIMNRYMTAMTKAILENKGTLDKYIGDAQMAFWNAPLNNPQHALDAVKTAFQMLKALETFNDEIKEEGVPAFGMGLGINTATVVVGNMGSDQRFDYTCLGDGVNLASRLEGQSKPYGVKLVIGPETANLVRDVYQVIELDSIAVKGKTEPARIFTVREKKDDKAEHAHNLFLELYRKGDWRQARAMALLIKTMWRGELADYYEMMYQRMEGKQPPVNWDGVYRATSK